MIDELFKTITIEVSKINGHAEVIHGVIGIDVWVPDDQHDKPRIFIDRCGSVCPARLKTRDRVGYDPVEGVIP